MRALIILGVALSLIATQQPAHARDTLVVMTQNQYFGADLTPLIGAEDFNKAVLEVLNQIQANDFPARADALAEEIADRLPDVVGLQEVFNITLNGLNGPAPYRDQLTDTLDALNVLGANYVAVASVQNTQLTIPIDFNGDSLPDAAVGVTDRDVILVRADIPASAVPFSQFCTRPSQDGGSGCNYQVNIIAPAPNPPFPNKQIEIERGFVGVDAEIRGKDYRFINTHLEVRDIDPTNPSAAAIQAAQATELIGTLQATTPAGRSVIIMGDMNSSPEDASLPVPPFATPYQQLAAHAYDAWMLRPGNPPEFTCCQLADLSNHRSDLYERIDMIFTSDSPRKVKARLLGQRVSDKTWPERLWPSDHAAVVAELTFE